MQRSAEPSVHRWMAVQEVVGANSWDEAVCFVVVNAAWSVVDLTQVRHWSRQAVVTQGH